MDTTTNRARAYIRKKTDRERENEVDNLAACLHAFCKCLPAFFRPYKMPSSPYKMARFIASFAKFSAQSPSIRRIEVPIKMHVHHGRSLLLDGCVCVCVCCKYRLFLLLSHSFITMPLIATICVPAVRPPNSPCTANCINHTTFSICAAFARRTVHVTFSNWLQWKARKDFSTPADRCIYEAHQSN